MARFSKTERDETLSATRRRLLEAAAVEFAQQGFVGANINKISLAAGFSKGTIYNYFPSKQALMLELITEAGAEHVEFIAARVRSMSEPAQRLAAFYEAGFRFVEQRPAQARFLLTTLYSPGVELQEAMYQAYRPMFALVAQEIVAEGIERGAFRQVDPQATANLLMTLYLGTASHVDEQGKAYMDPRQVAGFALNALKKTSNLSGQ